MIYMICIGGSRNFIKRGSKDFVKGYHHPAGGLGGAVSPPVGSRGKAPGRQTLFSITLVASRNFSLYYVITTP